MTNVRIGAECRIGTTSADRESDETIVDRSASQAEWNGIPAWAPMHDLPEQELATIADRSRTRPARQIALAWLLVRSPAICHPRDRVVAHLEAKTFAAADCVWTDHETR